MKHRASSIRGFTNTRHQHTKSGHHGYLVPGIVHPCSTRTSTFPNTHVVNTPASHSKVLILHLDLEIIIFEVYMIFLGPDRQTPSQYLKTDGNSFLLHCSMHTLQPLYYKALTMTYKSQKVLLNKPNTTYKIPILQRVEDSKCRILPWSNVIKGHWRKHSITKITIILYIPSTSNETWPLLQKILTSHGK